MKKKDNYTMNFAMMYLVHYTSFALISSQRQSFLNHVGYNLNQRSYIFAIIPIVTISMQMIAGYFSDRYRTVKKIMIPLILFSAITSYFFYSIQVQFYIFHFAIALLSQSFVIAITDLSDVWVLESEGPSKNNYGFIRAFGSAGWSIGSFLLARIVFAFGYQGLAMSILLLSIIILVIMIAITDDKALKATSEVKEAINIKDIIELFKDKDYLIAISMLLFVNFAVNLTGFVVVEKILELGGNEFVISNRGMIAAGVEVPLMLIGDRIYKRIGALNMAIIGISMHTLQFFGYFFATSNNAILFITIGQVISVPLYQVSIKYLLLKMSPEKLKTTGQMTGPAIVNGLTGIIYPLVAAAVITRFNVSTPFIISILCGFAGISIGLYLKVRMKGELV